MLIQYAWKPLNQVDWTFCEKSYHVPLLNMPWYIHVTVAPRCPYKTLCQSLHLSFVSFFHFTVAGVKLCFIYPPAKLLYDPIRGNHDGGYVWTYLSPLGLTVGPLWRFSKQALNYLPGWQPSRKLKHIPPPNKLGPIACHVTYTRTHRQLLRFGGHLSGKLIPL